MDYRIRVSPLKPLIDFFRILWRALVDTIDHDGVEHAGYLSFLGLLSLFPFLVFVMAIAGLFGEDFARSEFVELLLSNLPAHIVEGLRPRLLEIATGPSQGLLTVAILGAIWTSSSSLEGLRTVLNRAYRVHTPPHYLFRRMLSIGQLIVLTFVVIIVMSLLIVMPVIWHYVQDALHFDPVTVEPYLKNWGYIISALLLFATISMLYYVLPNVKQTAFSVLPGAAMVVVLWMGAARLLSYYLSRFEQVNLIYGSMGSIIAALLFFYILALIFIWGAEFNYLLTSSTGERIEEKETEEEEEG